jgi:Transposase DDE domain group 1
LTVAPPTRRVTLQVQATNTRPRFEVVADGQGICSHVGAALLGELADRLGLTGELGRRANRGVRAGAHDRGQVLRDLVVMLADGGDCVSDLATLGDQPELFGQVCSAATAWRIVAQQLPGDPRGIAALWSALASVRGRAWELGAAPAGPLILDVDATLVDAHSDKQGAAPTYKQGFGFHPLGVWLDRGDGTGEALAAILRPGNAGANTAADHLAVLGMALLGLPKHARRQPILVRADAAGATHAFVADIVRRKLWFSIGLDLTEPVRQAIGALPEQAWQPALDPDGRPRHSAWAAELAGLDLASSGWPEAPGRSAAASGPTPARHTSWPSPTSTATASRCSSPTRPTLTLPCWRPATVPTLTWKTASAPPRPAACATCRFGALPPTMPGSPWS